MKQIWVVMQGQVYDSAYVECVCKTKAIAEKLCREEGFKYCKKEDVWLGKLYNISYYREVVPEDYYE